MKTVFTCVNVPASLARTFVSWNQFEAQARPGSVPRRWRFQRGDAKLKSASSWCGDPSDGHEGIVLLHSLGDGSTRVSLQFDDGALPAAERASGDLVRFRSLIALRQVPGAALTQSPGPLVGSPSATQSVSARP